MVINNNIVSRNAPSSTVSIKRYDQMRKYTTQQLPPSPSPCYFLAVNGAAFRRMKAMDDRYEQHSLFKRVIFLASVFARMSPDDKVL
jgi:magnesium-transporting ATPase (P-type)